MAIVQTVRVVDFLTALFATDKPSGYTIPRSILQNLEFCSEYSVSSHILGFSSRILWFSAQVYVVVHGFPG